MKKILIITFALAYFSSVSFAQKHLVRWEFVSKKISGNEYEVTLKAKLEKGWHIYSQDAGEGPLPTTVSFVRSPVILLQGELNEIGILKVEESEVFNSVIRYYEDTITLVQRLKLRGKIKTSLKGNINFMICNNSQCLPPETRSFIVPLL